MKPGKEQIVFHASTAFKDAFGAWASERNLHMADVARMAIAEKIGYDLGREPARSRTPTYATKEEAKRASYDRAALIRWGNATSGRLLNDGEVEAATLIARAVANKDYETLAALKAATTAEPEPTEAEDEDGEAIDAAE